MAQALREPDGRKDRKCEGEGPDGDGEYSSHEHGVLDSRVTEPPKRPDHPQRHVRVSWYVREVIEPFFRGGYGVKEKRGNMAKTDLKIIATGADGDQPADERAVGSITIAAEDEFVGDDTGSKPDENGQDEQQPRKAGEELAEEALHVGIVSFRFGDRITGGTPVPPCTSHHPEKSECDSLCWNG